MTATGDGDRIRLARALFPELARDLDTALAGHSSGAEEFDAWLDRESEGLRAAWLGTAALAPVEGEARERFERVFLAVREIAGWIGLDVPQPETFTDAGVDLARLGSELDADPELMPVPAPHGLGAAAWQRLFARAAGASGAPVESGKELSLMLAHEVEREFETLDRLPQAPSVDRWTLRLIPAGPAPAVLGLSFEHGPHATLPEMLMLQLTRAVLGDPLVDTRSFTWLAGSLAGGRLGARHVYDVTEHAVRINCREVGNQGPYLGARPPVS